MLGIVVAVLVIAAIVVVAIVVAKHNSNSDKSGTKGTNSQGQTSQTKSIGDVSFGGGFTGTNLSADNVHLFNSEQSKSGELQLLTAEGGKTFQASGGTPDGVVFWGTPIKKVAEVDFKAYAKQYTSTKIGVDGATYQIAAVAGKQVKTTSGSYDLSCYNVYLYDPATPSHYKDAVNCGGEVQKSSVFFIVAGQGSAAQGNTWLDSLLGSLTLNLK